ncbi:hypothetical protein Ndes2526B_g04715 [Nannochloris sp. 'desiccata']
MLHPSAGTARINQGTSCFLRPPSAQSHTKWSPSTLLGRQNSLQKKYRRILYTAAYLPTEAPSSDKPATSSTGSNDKLNNSSSHLLTADEAQSLTTLHAGNVYELGIVQNATELASFLATDINSGLLSSRQQRKRNQENNNASTSLTLAERSARYGINTVASPPSATFVELFLEALDDFTVKILLGAGSASLALEYWLAGNDGSSPNWIEGVSILAAVAVVTLVTAGNNYQKEQQFKALQDIQREDSVRALRGGREVQLSTLDVLVGDLLLVETGDILCVDGVLVAGTDIKVDESHLTGEADDVGKDSEKAQALYSGSKVVSGFGRMIVTAVGKRSQSGAVANMIAAAGEGRWAARIATETNSNNKTEDKEVSGSSSSISSSIPSSSSASSELTYNTEGLGRLREETALQKKLEGYATVIGQLGLGAAVLATAALASRFSYDTFFVAQQPWDWVYLHNYLSFFITGVTILVVAVPEGLPLAVTISLAYSVMKMLEENNLVRHLGAAETMATATVICTDKTGTLTQNRMAVTRMWLAGEVIPNVGEFMSTQEPAPVLLIAGGEAGGEEEVEVAGASGMFLETDNCNGIGDVLKEAASWSRTFDDDDVLERLQCPELRQCVLDKVDDRVLGLLCHSVAVNSTANVFVDRQGRLQESGSRTEIALLQLSRALQTAAHNNETNGLGATEAKLLVQTPFTSERKRMSSLLALPSSSLSSTAAAAAATATTRSSDDGRLFVKGAAEIILEHCTWRLNSYGERIPLTTADRTQLLELFSGNGLRLLALAYRDISLGSIGRESTTADSTSGKGTVNVGSTINLPGSSIGDNRTLSAEYETNNGTNGFTMNNTSSANNDARSFQLKDVEALEQDLTLISVVGLEDPLRPEAADAILKCQHAGISVKMLTGDNAGTAANIARAANILTSPLDDNDCDKYGGNNETSKKPYEVMEGQQFRDMVVAPDGSINREAFLEIWPQLRVLARCTPADKFTIVTAVRSLTTDRVAMTGDGTNDAPALRAADVGFAMNSGTQVAKDAADIVLLDDNFQSIVVAALWGRNVYANVARFLQFQLTINVVAVIIAVGGALGVSESPLSAVQMLWVNLIMDSLASLALATEAPHPTLLDIPPFTANHQFLDPKAPMLKHVVGQATYQLGALVWLLVAAPTVLNFPAHIPGDGPSIHHTMVFNAFVMMQLFNQLNARKVSDESYVADGLSTAHLFLGVLGAEAVLQAVIVQFGGEAFSTVALDPVQWALCIGFGAGSLLVREALRKLPHKTVVEWLNGSK